VRFSNACNLRRFRSPALLNTSISGASKVDPKRYEGLWCSNADHLPMRDCSPGGSRIDCGTVEDGVEVSRRGGSRRSRQFQPAMLAAKCPSNCEPSQ
jgi:hypothetical protein